MNAQSASAATHARTGRPLLHRFLTAVLTNPLVMRVKLPIKDAWWDVKGVRITNPPLPPIVRSVLFVCLGNICRSPFAAALASRRFEERGWDGIHCASAGISTTQAAHPPREACEAAAAFGISLESHEPQPLTPQVIDNYDLVVVMEAWQLEDLRSRYPDAHHRLFLLPLFERRRARGFEGHHIVDPFGQPRGAFDTCYRRIAAALDDLIAALAATKVPRAQPRGAQS